MIENEWITTGEAAVIIRRTRQRVNQLCKSGVLRYRCRECRKFVCREDAEAFAANPPPKGRPRKEQ